MSTNGLINPNPVIYGKPPSKNQHQSQLVPDIFETIDSEQVFHLIRDIRDPEHPYSLEELHVVTEDAISVCDNLKECILRIEFTPTVPHCTLATLIGLCIRVQLNRYLSKNAKIDIYVSPGKHAQEDEINKQINDKERIQAALENSHILDIVNRCVNIYD